MTDNEDEGVHPALGNARTYGAVVTLRRWVANSKTGRLVSDWRVVVGVSLLVVGLSVVRVLQSRLDTTVKFLSFALAFTVVAALTWSLTDPPTE